MYWESWKLCRSLINLIERKTGDKWHNTTGTFPRKWDIALLLFWGITVISTLVVGETMWTKLPVGETRSIRINWHFFFSVINLLKFNSEFKHISLHVPFCHQHFYRNMMVIMTHVWKIYVFFSFSFFLYIILAYVLTLYLIFTRCLHYINLHYLQYIYYNTITLVKWNYSWSIYVIVCMLIVRVTPKNFVC